MDVRRGRMPHPRRTAPSLGIAPHRWDGFGRCDFQSRPVVCMERARVAAVVGRALRASRVAGTSLFRSRKASRPKSEVQSPLQPGSRFNAKNAEGLTQRDAKNSRGRGGGAGRAGRWGGATDSSSPTPGGRRVPPSSGRRVEFAHGGGGGGGGRNGAWGAIEKRTSRRGAGKKVRVAIPSPTTNCRLGVARTAFLGVDGGGDFWRMQGRVPGRMRLRRCGRGVSGLEKGTDP